MGSCITHFCSKDANSIIPDYKNLYCRWTLSCTLLYTRTGQRVNTQGAVGCLEVTDSTEENGDPLLALGLLILGVLLAFHYSHVKL